jgi:hypothetical protein
MADAIELLKAHAYGNDFLAMWRPAPQRGTRQPFDPRP